MFPLFGDGDVEILFGAGMENAVLHSMVLKLHSPFFRASVDEKWRRSGPQAAEKEKVSLLRGFALLGLALLGILPAVPEERTIQQRSYELRFERGTADAFLLKKGDTTDLELLSAEAGSKAAPEAANLELRRLKVIYAHKEVLGTFYYRPITLLSDVFDEEAREKILDIVEAAGFYGCEDLTMLQIDNYLMHNNGVVLSWCASNPIQMLELAMEVKCEWMFREAAVRLIGAPTDRFKQFKDGLQALELTELFDTKRAYFEAMLKDCDLAMFKRTKLTPLQGAPYRHRDITIASAFCREWLTLELQHGLGSGLLPDYALVYRNVVRNATRLDERTVHELEEFAERLGIHNGHVGSVGALYAVFRNVSTVVEPLLKDTTIMKKDDGRILLFVTIEDDELPWPIMKQ